MSGEWVINSGGIVHERMKSCSPGDECRAVVVIDPEDREQVKELADAINAEEENEHPDGERCKSFTCFIDCVQAALRTLANPQPAKPDEPLGLGAVVESIADAQYVRIGNGPKPWMILGGSPDSRSHTFAWEEIAVGRVLSEGVTA